MESPIYTSPSGLTPLTLNRQAKEVMEHYLFDGESLLWCDKPQARWSQFLYSLLPVVIPAGIIIACLLAAFLFEVNSYNNVGIDAKSQESVIKYGSNQDESTLAMLLFLVAGGVMIVLLVGWSRSLFLAVGGNRLVNLFYTSSTCYGVTSRRLLIIVSKSSNQVLSVNLRFLENLRLMEEADGFGSINFEHWQPHANPFKGEEMPPLIFRNIPNASEVFRLIAEAQNGLLSASSGNASHY